MVRMQHWRDVKCTQYLDGKSEGKKTLRRSRHGWEGYIKMDLKDIGC
jgi:hypothetical protein